MFIYLFMLFWTESELSTVSREKGEGGEGLFSSSYPLWCRCFPAGLGSPFSFFGLCPLHLNFPSSLTTVFNPRVWFSLDKRVSKGKTYWLLPLDLPTDLWC